MDIRNLMSLLWQRLWLMGLVAFLAGTAVYMIMSRSGAIPQYSATTIVAIGGDMYQQDIQDTAYLNLAESVTSDLLHLAQLEIVTGAVVQRLELAETPKAIAGALQVAQIEGTNLISIQATHKDPVIAAAIANEVAQQLRQFAPSRWHNFVLILEAAQPPTHANQTAVLPVMLAAFTAALFTMSLNLLYVYLRQPFYDERDVTDWLALPTLLTLPPIHQAWWQLMRGNLLAMSYPSAWSLKSACTQFLANNHPEDQPATLLIISPDDTFSNAFAAAQLAMAWADSGQKTSLIDMDTMRADLSAQLIPAPIDVGFSSLLQQPKTDLKRGRQSVATHPHLTLLGTHRLAHPVSIQAWVQGIDALWQSLSADEMVVLSAPPPVDAVETLMAAQRATIVLLVLDVRHATYQRTVDTISLLATNGASVNGVVLSNLGTRSLLFRVAHHLTMLTRKLRHDTWRKRQEKQSAMTAGKQT